jgi:hypothetical protein
MPRGKGKLRILDEKDDSVVARQAPVEQEPHLTDIAVYSGLMYKTTSTDQFLGWCQENADEGHSCVVILATLGGDAGIAYRISRALQRKYRGGKVTIAIPWLCKSAGTLLCIGAHELLFGKNGELGPLDVQLPQKDELIGTSSGLIPLHTLSTLRDESFVCFEKFFLSILEKSQGQISTPRAAMIATNLATELLGNVYAQIDPLLLGQSSRDLQIAKAYGERLNAVSRNLRPRSLQRLLMNYPAHEFVIDGQEAEGLFINVSPMPEALNDIVAQNMRSISAGLFSGNDFFSVISNKNTITDEKEGKTNEESDEESGTGAGPEDAHIESSEAESSTS